MGSFRAGPTLDVSLVFAFFTGLGSNIWFTPPARIGKDLVSPVGLHVQLVSLGRLIRLLYSYSGERERGD